MTRRSGHDDDTLRGAQSSAEGWRFDRYVISSLIGEGGMGQVYRAHDPMLDRTVALKVLSKTSGAAKEATQKLVREARLAAKLEHPNVVAVYDAGEYQGAPFIAMEFVKGKALSELIDEGGAALERKLGWLLDVARALAAAHRRGLVHRDIKPGNVLVRDDDDTAKVLDFGLARHLQPLEGSIPGSPTLDGILVGTPHYMAPEQMGDGPIDGRADQFAWGVVAYLLLTGSTPWAGENVAQVMMSRLAAPVTPFAERVPGLDPAVHDAVLRTLSKNPTDRFEVTDELVRVLEGALGRTSLVLPRLSRPSMPALRLSSRPPPPLTEKLEVKRAAPQPDKSPEPTLKTAVPAPKRSRGMALGIAAVGIGTTILCIVVSHRVVMMGGAGTASSASSTSTATSASRVMAVTDLPPPRTTSKEALASYARAMQAYRDGVLYAAMAQLEQALAQDPEFAAAHLRLALLARLSSLPRARDHFAKALALRSSLDLHDQELLQALGPLVQRDPADYAEAARRLTQVRARFPDDAEIALWAATVDAGAGTADAATSFERVLALDPAFGWAYYAKAHLLLVQGRFDDVKTTVDACLAVVPSSEFCLWARASVERQMGDSAGFERDTRAVIAIDGDGARWWAELAEAVYARTGSTEAVKELLDQETLRETETDLTGVRHAYSLAVLEGDFPAAERALREHFRLVSASTLRATHAEPVRKLVELLSEEGRAADAAAVAEEFLRRREGWSVDAAADEAAIARDPVPAMLAAEVRGGRIQPDTLARERDAWALFWGSRVGPLYRPFVWAHGWAAVADTPEDATAALAALADWGGAPPAFTAQTHLADDIGRTYVLASRQDEGLIWVRRAVSSCTSLDQPIAHIRSNLRLGHLLEDAGDRAGACRAYGYVLARWGKAKPGSVTAADARKAAAKLHCD